MSGKCPISEPKKRSHRGARVVLLCCFAVVLDACFVLPEGQPDPDGGLPPPVYAWPPEVLSTMPEDPISDFEFVRGTENCLFKITATVRDRDSAELDLRVVTDNREQYRRRADGRRIDVTQGDTQVSFLVRYLDFGPAGSPTSVAQHSISLFITDAVDAWEVPDSDTAIGASGTDLGTLREGAAGNLVELRWLLLFKDGCCPAELQEGDPVLCVR